MTFEEVKRDFLDLSSEASAYIRLASELDDVRYCRWSGQSPDGRKWSKNTGKPVFPWDGASDIRPWTVDEIILDDVDVMRTADKNCRMQVLPTHADQQELASATTSVLDWISLTLMPEELEREKELFAQWRQHYGSSVMGIDWVVEMDVEDVVVSAQDLMQIAQMDETFGATLQYVTQNINALSQQDLQAAAAEFGQYFPGVDPQRAFTELMQTGQFTFPRPYVKTNRPTVCALRVFNDVFFPKTTFDLQKAPWVVRRDVLTKPEAEERGRLEKWDPQFLAEVLRYSGASALYTVNQPSVSRFTERAYIDEMKGQVEVYYAYYQGRSAQGQRRLLVSIFHPSCSRIGRQLPLPYLHGKYPFVLAMREKRSRAALESRAVGDIAESAQFEVKTQRDSRNDRTSISTLPPLTVPLGRGKQQYKLGPAAQLGVLRPGELSWLAPPPMDATTLEIENSVQRTTSQYFGKVHDGVDPNAVVRKQQRLINGWLGEMREVLTQVYQLCQQYLPAQEWEAVSGVQGIFPTQSRQLVQRNVNLMLFYDARDLNVDTLKAKLELMNTLVLSTDVAGVMDRAGMTRWAASAIDPSFARLFVKPAEAATQAEVDQTTSDMTKIGVGVPPQLYSGGVNAQLRLQTIQEVLQQSQSYLQLIQANPTAQQLLTQYVKALQFQIQQQQNAQVGRLGVAPQGAQTLAPIGPAPPPTTP